MRNRIFAAVGVAALATVGIAAPASAVSDTTADLWLVHAFPDEVLGDSEPSAVTIDIGGGAIVLDNVQPETVAPQVDLDPGTYNVTITRESDDAEVFNDDVTLEAGMSYTAVAHPNVDNDAFVLSVFVNDISTIDAGEGKVTVRHTAGVGAVDVRSGDTVVAPGLANPNEGTLELPAGVIDDVNVVLADTDTRAIELGDVTLEEGQHIFVHAFGPDGDDFGGIVFAIDGLHSTPDGIPGGSAGLVTEGSPLGLGAGIAGALALMLLIAGAVVATRRNTVSAER